MARLAASMLASTTMHLLLLLAVAAPSAPAKPKLAVLPVQLDTSARGAVPDIFDDYVLAAVHERGRYAAIGQDDVNAVLSFEKQKEALGCDELSCFADIGGALGVDKLMVVKVAKVEQRWLVSLKLIDIRSTTVEARTTDAVTGSPAALVESVPAMVNKLFGGPVATPAAASPPRRCEVTLAAEGCPNRPTDTWARGTFVDDWDGSSSSKERCLRRARELFTWCGSTSPVAARFYEGGSVAGEQLYAPASRCEIQMPPEGCPGQPSATWASGRFNDDWDGSAGSKERCLRRAEEFFSWCGTRGGVTARFYEGTAKVGERVHAPATRCQIQLPPEGCPGQPSATWATGSINDNWEGAGASLDRCLRRADEYAGWCATRGAVLARYFEGDRLAGEKVSGR